MPISGKRLSIQDRLALVKFDVDHEEAHIHLERVSCSGCGERPCLYACPAGLYTLTEAGGIAFDYAGCLECGTCRVVCPKPGAICWTYPRGSFGVQYRYG